MKRTLFTPVLFLAPFLTVAPLRGAGAALPGSGDRDAEIRELRERVAKLETRMAELEKQLGSPAGKASEAQRAKLVARARERMRKDNAGHTPEQLREAEDLYQVANKNFRSPEAAESLRKMVEKYPDLNRTGCALLYLGQMAKGDERERLLKQAIEKHSDCFYGDGVQVGALARFILAQHYLEAKQPDRAKGLFEEVRGEYPDSIDHQGWSLVAQIRAD